MARKFIWNNDRSSKLNVSSIREFKIEPSLKPGFSQVIVFGAAPKPMIVFESEYIDECIEFIDFLTEPNSRKPEFMK